MSSHYYLCCERTGECVEAVAYVGKWCGPRIEANALQAFLVYHLRMASDAPLVMRELESFVGDGLSLVSSLEEAAEELASIGTFHGYKPPVMVWTEKNYRSLASRAAGLVAALDDYQHAPGGGVWVRRTDDGRII